MKWWIASILLAGTALLSAQAAPAKLAIADDDDYVKVMKEVGALNNALRKALSTPPEGDPAPAAARLEVLFKDVQAYWEAKKVEDATTAARTAATAAAAVSKAVAAHEPAAAISASQTLAGTCAPCHNAHRERLTDAFYRIK